ncbi:MAG: HAD family hydrolase [Candidatus Altiarchaeota archaeon]|nr:HAD family hydrolase [Candidatus Altiarchaeota archaeon]
MKAMIFDFDGTLVDSVECIWKEYSRVMKLLNLPKVGYREFTKHLGKPWDQVLNGMWPDIDMEEFNRHYKVDAEKVAPIARVSAALEELSGDYLLAILTSRGERTLRMHMERVGMKPGLFKAIMHKDNLRNHKPDPRAIEETCRALGVGKSEVVYVGDSVIDAECASNAGVSFVGVLSGGASRGDFNAVGVDCVIESIAELPALLRVRRGCS